MDDELFILWTNADEITFTKMVSMYARNALIEHWWGAVTIIIWGATAKLATESELVQEHLRGLKQAGVHLTACKACSDQIGTSEKLKELGVELKYWGVPLTELLKSGKKLLTV